MSSPLRLAVILVLIVVSGCARSGAPTAHVSPASSQPSTPAAALPTPTPPAPGSPTLVPTPSPLPQPSPAPPASPSPVDTTVPTPRSNATWVYDAAVGEIVLYGGNNTTGNYNEFPQPLGDTWAWDGTSWSRIGANANAPAARFSANYAYDAVHKMVVLHGGLTGGSSFNDTWLLDGTRWLLQSPPQQPTAAPALQPMSWDSSLNLVLLYDWTGQWPATPLDQTWSWDGTTWKQIRTASAPAGSAGFGMLVYDPGRKDTVFCGQGINGPVTWTFDGTTWTQKQGSSGTASTTFVAAEDDARSNVVLFGADGDTWTWDGSRWTPANPLHSPGARKGVALTYDPVHKVVVLFGGSSGDGASLVHHNDIWTWDGQDWTKVSGT